MATPVLELTSKDLAYKLQDPVSAGTVDGERFTADGRLRYINRAYRRLIHLVGQLYPHLIEKVSKHVYKYEGFNTNSEGIVGITNFDDILNVYTLWTDGPSDPTRAIYIRPEEFSDVETNQNTFYTPDLNTHNIYYSVINGLVSMLPKVQYLLAFVSYKAQATTFGYGNDQDLDVSSSLLDTLLAFAAYEAYLDLGQADLAGAYKTDAMDQLGLLGTVKQEKEIKDELD